MENVEWAKVSSIADTISGIMKSEEDADLHRDNKGKIILRVIFYNSHSLLHPVVGHTNNIFY